MLLSIPLLILAVGLYNVLALTGGPSVDAPALSLTLPSGTLLPLSYGDLLVILGLVLLFVEIFKATRTGTASIIDHLLSVGLFVFCLIELILFPAFGTTIFLFLTLMTLIDVVAGFTVTISTARRDIGLDEAIR
ncbi:MAG: hypothetical protein MI785_13745 [Kiloniellales bacterium]|nr:hypothetical protein [Kiloniellales bacterium]